MSITIIYPYRNRDLKRIENSLNSLRNQTNKQFEVLFVDYGSDYEIAEKVKQLVLSYSFSRYLYSYHLGQPWSRAKAINIGLRYVDTSFCFIADVDMIFSKELISVLLERSSLETATYFKVGFLSEKESQKYKEFEEYDIKFYSSIGASGLSLFPTEKLKSIRGFDEFFHYWGAEDNDIHNRLNNIGVKSVFYNEKALMLHQWHKIYRAFSKNKLTENLRVARIEKINHAHLVYNNTNKIIKVNKQGYGMIIHKNQFEELLSPTLEKKITTKKESIDYLIKEMSVINKGEVFKLVVKKPTFLLKETLKKISRGEFLNGYYSLKAVNDILLKEILFHYQNNIYIFKVSQNLSTITLTIKL